MKSYILRIYRRGPEHRSQITGVVEGAESGNGKTFHNLMELWSIIAEEPEEGSSTSQTKKINFQVQG